MNPPPPRNFTGLLSSCRALHDEAAALLYSANRFVIFYSDQGSLGPLSALTPTAIASLTSLKVVLNQASCHEPVDSYLYPPSCCSGRKDGLWAASYDCARYHDGLHRRPLDLAVDADSTSAMLREWRDTAEYLSYHVVAGRLKLSLVCDIDATHDNPHALEAARLAVAPLASFLLKDCHVRLSRTRHRPFQQLAEDAALQARGSAMSLSPGPTMARLPREVRFRILEYTDLIAPWGEVTWSRQHRGYQVCRPPCRFRRERKCPSHIHNGCRLTRCGPDHDGADARSPGCFCRRRHAAFSVSCNCWLPPTDLFLVCRVLCRDAQFVFFSRNRFVVHDFQATPPCELPPVQVEPWEPENDYGPEIYYPYERFAVSEFLRDIVPVHCLADLRFLEVVFPPYLAHGWPRDEHAPVQEWRDTTKWLRGKVTAPALIIRFVMAPMRNHIEANRTMTAHQGSEMVRGYMRVMHYLKCWLRDDGLAGFYVQAVWPWQWTQDMVRRTQLDGSWALEDLARQIGERCESQVRDGNLSLAYRKPEPKRSVWQRQYKVWSKMWDL
jgi:hypothetical protein